MTDDSQSTYAEVHQWLTDCWASSLSDVLEAMSGERPAVKVESGSASLPDDTEWWEQQFDFSPQAPMWIGTPTSTCEAIGTRALQAAGVEDGTPEDTAATYRELLQQSLSSLAQQLGAQTGREVSCLEGRTASERPAGSLVQVTITYSGQTVADTYLVLDDLVRFLVKDGEAADSGEDQAGSGEPPEIERVEKAERGNEPSRTIDVLLDVELPVSVSFGRAHLPLKDVLKLTSGSIVELNRSVSEPVEVIVNNCVIARGSVVVVDGNYGVRISQIISRKERLRTLN